ncbi:MAG: ROK family transcriptional regulator [Sphaerochaeta sp.]|jgi:predicted NBD/HSP70 family sugar kinase|nr:ROK family transcriptional regulator [Sphaerochaeta sp.]MDX9915831.1 ROK family transcriptional regulator [Sphaerochaeta sp.]
MNHKIINSLMQVLDRPNELRIVQTLLLEPGLSRPELAERLGLSLSAVTQVVNALIRKGYVVETGLKKSDSGRSSSTLAVDTSRFVSIGVGLSQYRISIEVIDLDGVMLFSAYEDLDKTGWQSNFTTIKDHIATFLEGSKDKEYHILGIGIARPGFVQFEKRELHFVPEMFEWEDDHVCREFEDAFGFGVEISSTSTAALSGEVYFGGGRNFPSSLLVNISSTDISIAMIRANLIDRGMDANPRVFGQRIISAFFDTSASLHESTLNRLVCMTGIEANYLELTGNRLDYPAICRQARVGDHLAVQALSKAATIAGLAISDLICSLFPDNIIISGSVVDDNIIYRNVAMSVASDRVRSICDAKVAFSLTELKGKGPFEDERERNFSLAKSSATLVFENIYLARGDK